MKKIHRSYRNFGALPLNRNTQLKLNNCKFYSEQQKSISMPFFSFWKLFKIDQIKFYSSTLFLINKWMRAQSFKNEKFSASLFCMVLKCSIILFLDSYVENRMSVVWSIGSLIQQNIELCSFFKNLLILNFVLLQCFA